MFAAASGGFLVPEEKKSRLTLYIAIAIVAAVACALAFPRFAVSLDPGGEIFLRILKMVVVPLVMASVMSGVLGMGDIRKLGRPGLLTILFYLTTTVVAVLTGLILVNAIQPGVGAFDVETLRQFAETGSSVAGEEPPGISTILTNLLLMLFTDNLFAAAAEADILPLIFFSIVFAGVLTTLGQKVSPVTRFIEAVNEGLIAFVLLLMKVAPLGIFCLVAARFGEAQAEGRLVEIITQTGWYSLTVLLGLSIHAFATLAALFWVIRRQNPYRYLIQMSEAVLTAFSTASSSATLPITMECAVEKARISRRSVDFVLPVGATINMDGTALYEAVAAIFIAQAIGFELTVVHQLTIAVTATLAAIGAAGIPQAGLVTMVIVLNAVGLPVEYIGVILSVDWLLDRFRTAVNVYGDSVGAAVLEKSFEA